VSAAVVAGIGGRSQFPNVITGSATTGAIGSATKRPSAVQAAGACVVANAIVPLGTTKIVKPLAPMHGFCAMRVRARCWPDARRASDAGAWLAVAGERRRPSGGGLAKIGGVMAFLLLRWVLA
jgi:hypothetical protein